MQHSKQTGRITIFTHNIKHLSRSTIAAGLTCLFLISQSTGLQAQNLPELNDSASLIMNDAEEQLLGRQIMLGIRAKSNVSDDLLLLDYINTLANTLVLHSPRPLGRLDTGLIVDSTINAFAVPGGYITLNTGLISNTRSEDELAAVIAHEIGHHSQRHIARSIERSKQLTLPATAALIGGILIGGQVGAAAVLSTQAAVGSDRLAYSRTFETEADATGMAILAATGYQPSAMPAFFQQLEKQSQLYGGQIPAFLRTHPISSDRVADSLDRAARISVSAKPAQPVSDKLDFAHAKVRILALYSESNPAIVKQFERDIKAATTPESTNLARYGLSIVLREKGDYAHAKSTLETLISDNPDVLLYQLEAAALSLAAGETQLAQQHYQALYQNDKNNLVFVNGLASAALQNKDYPGAIRVLRKALRRAPQTIWAYELLAQAYGAQGNTLNALFIQAQKMKQIGRYENALSLLSDISSNNYPDQSDYLLASIEDLVSQLEIAKRQLDNFKL